MKNLQRLTYANFRELCKVGDTIIVKVENKEYIRKIASFDYNDTERFLSLDSPIEKEHEYCFWWISHSVQVFIEVADEIQALLPDTPTIKANKFYIAHIWNSLIPSAVADKNLQQLKQLVSEIETLQQG